MSTRCSWTLVSILTLAALGSFGRPAHGEHLDSIPPTPRFWEEKGNFWDRFPGRAGIPGLPLVLRTASDKVPGSGAADEVPPVANDPLPEEFQDPDFNRFIDWHEVGRAYGTMDPMQLTELARKLGAAERALHRTNKEISSERLFTDALEAARSKHDQKALGRLEEVAGAWNRLDLQAKATAAKKAAANRLQPRALKTPWDDAPPKTRALIQSFQAGIESAAALGDRDALEEYEQRIVVSDHLPEAARAELLKTVTAALKTAPAATDQPAHGLRQLVAGCRALTPAEYIPGRTSWLFPGGYYQEVDPKVWVEKLNTSQRRLRETTRNRQYVELLDRAQNRTIRLYNMKAWERHPGDQQWQFLARGHWEDPALVPLDPIKFSEIRGQVVVSETRSFPHLGQRFEVLGPATKRYNCIAWSLNVTTEWLWPGYRIADFDKLNGQRGYHRIDGLDFGRRAREERIVLYGKKARGRLEATHQARQLADGSWSSKLGALPLIRHLKPEDIDGDTYGYPVAVYVRTRSSSARSVEDE